jgi:hypothetical protein
MMTAMIIALMTALLSCTGINTVHARKLHAGQSVAIFATPQEAESKVCGHR